MKFLKIEFFAVLSISLGSLFFSGCSSSNSDSLDSLEFHHIEFLDNPNSFKGDTLTSIFHYDGTLADNFKLGDVNKRYNNGESEINEFRAYRYWSRNNSNRLDLVFELPKGLDVPNVSHPDIIQIRFVCTKGSHYEGNKVLSITR